MRRTLLAIVAVLLLALAAAVVFRTTLLELALGQGLRAAGFDPVTLSVAHLDLASAEVRDIALGDDLGLERLTLSYTPAGLLRRRLDRVVAHAPVVDLSAERGTGVAAIRGLAASEASPSESAVALPTIEVRSARIEWLGPVGMLVVAADGELTPGPGGTLRAAFDLTARADAGQLRGRLEFARQATGAASGVLRLAPGDLVLGDLAVEGVSSEWSFAHDGQRLTAATGNLELPLVRHAGEAVGKAQLETRLTDQGLALRGEGSALGADLALRLDGRLDIADWQLHLSRLAASIDVASDAPILRTVALPELVAGRARLRLVGGNVSLPLKVLASDLDKAYRLLLASGVTATVTMDVVEGGIAGWADGLAATIGIDLEAAGDSVVLKPVLPVLIDVERLAPELLAGFGLPAASARQLTGPWTLALDSAAEGHFLARLHLAETAPRVQAGGTLAVELDLADRLRASGLLNAAWPTLSEPVPLTASLDDFKARAKNISAGDLAISELTLSGKLDWRDGQLGGNLDAAARLGQIAHGDWRARGVRLSLPVGLEVGAGRLVLSPTGGGRLRIDRPRTPAPVTLPDRLELRLRPGGGPLLNARLDGGGSLEAALGLASEAPIMLNVVDGDAAAPMVLRPFSLRFGASVAPAGLSRLTGRLSGAGVELPKHHLAVDTIEAEIGLGKGAASGTVRVDIANIVSSGPDLPVAPLKASGRLALTAGGIDFTARLADRAAIARIDATGRYDYATGRLETDLALPAVAFRADGPQPSDLSPRAADLGKVDGTISAQARVTWQDGTLDGTGTVILEQLSLDREDLSVADISGSLRFTSLWPPETAPRQQLHIRRIDTAVPIEDIGVSLSLEAIPDSPLGRLRIDRASGRVDFARISVSEATLDPVAGRYRLQLGVESLDLAKLLKLADVEGLEATGVLNGAMPILIAGEEVVIEPSVLEASGPGVIHFTSEKARSALASGGDQVALLLQALEDFRYQKLALGLEKPAEGSAKVTLSITGHNPEVLDGHPFAVNIDLSGDFDSLFRTALDAYNLSGRAIRATVE
ncbi:MAG: YdbH domain-containing protein [Alphaproteobacteria bacterium]|jgi:hypothetical protein|nr:YdbH domain-containing protein [Alphaproteobacteria bacterium]